MAPAHVYYDPDSTQVTQFQSTTGSTVCTFDLRFEWRTPSVDRKAKVVKTKKQLRDERSAKISKDRWFVRNEQRPNVYRTLNKGI